MKCKLTIGRKEKIDLPLLGITNIETKIDTGAFTSSIHAHKVELAVENGKEVLKVQFLHPKHKLFKDTTFTFTEFQQRSIRNSFGKLEKRYTIFTEFVLYGEYQKVEFSLANRKDMRHAILFGRKAITGKYVVDPAKVYVASKFKRITKNPITYLP